MIKEILEYNKRFVEEKGYEKFSTTKYPDKKIAIIPCCHATSPWVAASSTQPQAHSSRLTADRVVIIGEG